MRSEPTSPFGTHPTYRLELRSSKVIITGGNPTEIHNTHLHAAPSRGIDILKAATAPAALYNSREREQLDPPKCHPHTREAILEKILAWVKRRIDTEYFIVWLYGAAGAGKSAIAQSMAEVCHKHGLLLATFFFSRSDASRNSSERLVATIAYQIIRVIPESRALVEASIENDPLIFDQSLDDQFTRLILRPLQHLEENGIFEQKSLPPLIILDGLDECMDGMQTRILDMIPTAVAESGRLIFLVASRPEQEISMRMRSGTIEKHLTHISLDTDYQSNGDIELFFRDKFDDIKRNHPLRSYIPSSWPAYHIIQTLLWKSSGQFIYASTVIKYISSTRHRPTSRLDVILGVTPPRNDVPFAQLGQVVIVSIRSEKKIKVSEAAEGTRDGGGNSRENGSLPGRGPGNTRTELCWVKGTRTSTIRLDPSRCFASLFEFSLGAGLSAFSALGNLVGRARNFNSSVESSSTAEPKPNMHEGLKESSMSVTDVDLNRSQAFSLALRDDRRSALMRLLVEDVCREMISEHRRNKNAAAHVLLNSNKYLI